VRFVSHRTDLTLSQLAGHMEASPGHLEIYDAPGNVTVKTQDDITLENNRRQGQNRESQRQCRSSLLGSAEGRHRD